MNKNTQETMFLFCNFFFYLIFFFCMTYLVLCKIYLFTIYPGIEFCEMYMGILLPEVGLRDWRSSLSTSSFEITFVFGLPVGISMCVLCMQMY